MITSSKFMESSILIVDDREANISLLEQILQGAGYRNITTTMDPTVVCGLHEKNRYDLILLDLQMPVMDGFQVLEGLKEIEKECYVPVLVITAQPGHKIRALNAGAKDFISKPFDLAEVLMRVHNMLEVRLMHLKLESRTKAAEAQFIEAQKMEALGQLAGGVAHDFNNILGVIIGYADLLALDLPDKGGAQEHLEEIRQAAERAAGLTGQLLIFSRRQKVVPVVLDLNQVVMNLEQMLRRLTDENIELTIVQSNHPECIKADVGYVGQVLMNLVVNARDAMPGGGKLTITTSNGNLDGPHPSPLSGTGGGDFVILSVKDTGSGMTAQVKERIFETFFTTKPDGKGTGLGLATCQTIVHQSGGHIRVVSEIGKGTSFHVCFPRVYLRPDPIISSKQTGTLPRGTETVLVVEDDPAVRHLARGILQSLGYTVLTAANGRDGLQTVNEHKGSPILLVITDVIMPLMGGKVMSEWLKTAYPDLKIIFTSGYPDEALSHHGELDAEVEFLAKPYTPAGLATKVRELLDLEASPRIVPAKA